MNPPFDSLLGPRQHRVIGLRCTWMSLGVRSIPWHGTSVVNLPDGGRGTDGLRQSLYKEAVLFVFFAMPLTV